MSDLVERLRRLDACAVSDALDRLGMPNTTIAGIASLTGPSSIAGRAVTVLLGPVRSEVSARHLCAAAVDDSGADDVIVIDHQARTDCAGWGGNLSRAARVRGIAGTLIYGAARDIDESRDIGYPVYGTAATPRTARGRTHEHAWNVPIDVGGIAVHPGDYVIADGSGLVVIPADSIGDVLATAEDIARREASMATAIETGTPVSEAMGADYERMTERRSGDPLEEP